MTTKRIEIDGIVTYWTTGEVDLARLRERLIPAEPGIEKLLPESTTPLNALREALADAYPEKLIRPLKRKGFDVVLEEKGEWSNVYAHNAAAWIADGDVVFDGGIAADKADEIRRRFLDHLNLLQPGTAGSLLAKIIGDWLGGTMLRPKTGGIYWLPSTQAGRYDVIARAFEYAGMGAATVYTIRHAMDEAACKAVHDAIVHEMTLEADNLNDAIATQKMGERALATKQREAEALLAKVAEYERMLDTDLAAARDALGKAKDAAAAAQLVAAAAADQPELPLQTA